MCCLYDRAGITTGIWTVQGCELRHKSPTSTICHNIVGEPGTWGEWRPDIPSNQCNSADAARVCDKGPVDLKVTKAVSAPSNPAVGDTITYTITVANLSTTTAAVGTKVVDQANNVNLEYIDAPSDACIVQPFGSISCSIGILPPGGSSSFTMSFKLKERGTSGCSISNVAIAFSENTDPVTSNNYGSAVFNAYCATGGSSRSTAAPSSGSSVSSSAPLGACCLKLGFSGNNDKRCKGVSSEQACTALIGTKVTLDSGLQYTVQDVAWKPTQQCSAELCPPLFEEKPCCSPTNACAKKEVYLCEQEGGRPMDTNSCTTTVCTVSSASVSASKKSSSSSSQAPDLRIVKTLIGGPVFNPGDTVSYSVTIENTGKEAALVTLNEFPPPGLTVTGMPAGCVNIPGLITCSNLSVPPGGTTLTFSFTADNPKGCTVDRFISPNKAYVVAANPKHDTNTLNNIGESGSATVKCPTWETNKELVSAGPFRPGDTVEFKLTYTRKGGPYELSAGNILPKDYAVDRLEHVELTQIPAGCVLVPAAAYQQISCNFPATSKDGTVTYTMSAVIKDSACPVGLFKNTAFADRGTETSPGQVLSQDSVTGTVDCSPTASSTASSTAASAQSSATGPKYCCSFNRCVEKTGDVSCDSGAAQGTDPMCGGACVPKFCCPAGAVSCNQQTTAFGACPLPKDGTLVDGYNTAATCNAACAASAVSSAPTASAASSSAPPQVWCCNRNDADEFSCSASADDVDCGIERAPGSALEGYKTLADCQAVPECKPETTETAGCCLDDDETNTRACTDDFDQTECEARVGQHGVWFANNCSTQCGGEVACGPGCYPVGPDGICPLVFAQEPASWWGRFMAFVTGTPLKAQLELLEGSSCCCPPGGGSSSAGTTSSTGGTGGSSAASSNPAKQCGACIATSQVACNASPNRCVWESSWFAFLSVLFGGDGGSCEQAPECIDGGGGTSSLGGPSSVGGTISSSIGGGSSEGQNSSVISASSASSLSSRSSSSSSRSKRIVTINGIQPPLQCGDRIVQAERGEQCEPGIENVGDVYKCSLACLWAVCPPGTTLNAAGTCTDLPECPAAPVAANAAALHLHCVNACSGSPDSGKCTAACVCGCRPGAPFKAGESAGSCVSSCLDGDSAAAACAGRTTGDELTQCCMNSCIGYACPLI